MSNRICIVTDQFGDMSVGAKGHLMLAVAEASVEEGYTVDVILLSTSGSSSGHHQHSTLSKNIEIIKFSVNDQLDDDVSNNPSLRISYNISNYLIDKCYKSVHFFDSGAFGFYSTLAKSQGLLKSVIVTHLTGPSGWARKYGEYFPTLAEIEQEDAEYSQIAGSDLVLGDSLDILEWLCTKGFDSARFAFVDWPLPSWVNELKKSNKSFIGEQSKSIGLPANLIFFGQQNRISGYEEFLDFLQTSPLTDCSDVWIFGPYSQIDFEFTGILALRRLANIASSLNFVTDISFKQISRKLCNIENSLCILPGRHQSAHYELSILKEIGIRAHSWRLTDLSVKKYHPSTKIEKAVIFQRNWAEITRTSSGLESIENSHEETKSRQGLKWKAVLSRINELSSNQSFVDIGEQGPLVSVCLVHHDRPYLLAAAISAIMQQTYSNIEVVLVDDGSSLAESKRYLAELKISQHRFPLRVIESQNQYLGAARNLAASHARGEFIIFHDDDNVAETRQVEIFIRAILNCNADILTCLSYSFRDGPHNIKESTNISFFPTGIRTLYSFFSNRFGDANAIFKKSTFLEIGGFTEYVGLGWEDWEIFLRASISGKFISVVPVALFNYRTSETGMVSSGNLSNNFKRIFSMLEEEKVHFGTEILKQANRELLLSEAKKAVNRLTRKEPFCELQQQINDLDPSHPDAKFKLMELAVALGWRVQTKSSCYAQKNLDDKAVLSFTRPVERLKATAFSTSRLEIIEPLLVARGWTHSTDRESSPPDGVLFGKNFYRTIVAFSESRPDVVEHLRITPPSDDLGFIIICGNSVKPVKRWLRNDFTRQQTKKGVQTSAYFIGKKPALVHLDLLIDYIKVRVPLSITNWKGKIKIELEVGWQMPIYYLSGHSSLTKIEKKQNGFFEVKLDGHPDFDYFELVIPKNYHAYIVLEPNERDTECCAPPERL